MQNKPTSKIAKVGTALKTGATKLVDEATEFATDVVDTGVSTAKDVFGVFDVGDDVADVDASGFDGQSSKFNIEDHDTDAHFNGDSNTQVLVEQILRILTKWFPLMMKELMVQDLVVMVT